MKHIGIFSDIHCGKSDLTRKIVSTMISFFVKKKDILSKLDTIVLSGDVFDKMLTTNSVDYKLSLSLISLIVSFCRRHKIRLRVLEGTPSHDNKQMASVSSILSEIGDIDYKYIDTLSIEVVDGKTCLYLPDKFKETGEEIQEAITAKLKEHKLTKVDLIFAHGNFSYQLPAAKLKSALDENFFLDITNYYIVIGHIHNRSVWKRIIAPGSFERLEHGQTIDKGMVILNLGKDIDTSSFQFVDNEDAMLFDTIDLIDVDIKEAYKKVKKHIKDRGMTEDDSLRIIASIEDYASLEKRLLEDGVVVRITRFQEKQKVTFTNITKETTIDKVEVISITEKNIFEMLLKRSNISDLQEHTKSRMCELIKELNRNSINL